MTLLKEKCTGIINSLHSPVLLKIINSGRFVFIVSGMLGAVFFLYFFGVRVLDPTNVDWLMISMGTDRFQHYLGWVAFRHSDWFFPPGMHNGVTYPLLESIVYSDSIPILAIPFKAISSILPQNFHYFGWFGLLMYVLQGGFGGLIVKKISGYTWFSIICSLFFTLSISVFYRMFSHTALAAHFLLLASIYLCITKDNNRSTLRSCVLWSILIGITTGIHIYLLVMIFGIMCIYVLDNLFEHKKIIKTIIEIVVPTFVILVVMFFIGIFHSTAQGSAGGLGGPSTNLNQLFNPFAVYSEIGAPYSDYSRFIRAFPLIPDDGWFLSSRQSEGNAYLGLGMIILMFIAASIFIEDFKDYKEKLSDKKTLRRVILTVLTFIAFYIFALSPVVTFNDRVLFDYRSILPGKVIILWDTFRATGRFVWVSGYIIMITAIWVVAKKFKKHTLIIIAIMLIFIQYQDQSGYYYAKGEFFRNEQVYVTDLQSDIWGIIASDYEHLMYVGYTVNRNSILKFAVHNGLTVNDTYLARKDIGAIEAVKIHTWEQINDGITRDDMVYIFETIPVEIVADRKLYVYTADGMILGFARELINAQSMAGVTYITPESVMESGG